jgi:pilus assembly protein Flp/PilA
MRRFRTDEAGLALTEYLILLALLTSGVILAIGMIGGNLGLAWSGWTSFYSEIRANPDGETAKTRNRNGCLQSGNQPDKCD